MTTKSGARIYRGAPRDRLKDGACPTCHRVVNIRRGKRAWHHDESGVKCTGSGVNVGERMFVLDELPPVRMPTQGNKKGRVANPWSGKP